MMLPAEPSGLHLAMQDLVGGSPADCSVINLPLPASVRRARPSLADSVLPTKGLAPRPPDAAKQSFQRQRAAAETSEPPKKAVEEHVTLTQALSNAAKLTEKITVRDTAAPPPQSPHLAHQARLSATSPVVLATPPSRSSTELQSLRSSPATFGSKTHPYPPPVVGALRTPPPRPQEDSLTAQIRAEFDTFSRQLRPCESHFRVEAHRRQQALQRELAAARQHHVPSPPVQPVMIRHPRPPVSNITPHEVWDVRCETEWLNRRLRDAQEGKTVYGYSSFDNLKQSYHQLLRGRSPSNDEEHQESESHKPSKVHALWEAENMRAERLRAAEIQGFRERVLQLAINAAEDAPIVDSQRLLQRAEVQAVKEELFEAEQEQAELDARRKREEDEERCKSEQALIERWEREQIEYERQLRLARDMAESLNLHHSSTTTEAKRESDAEKEVAAQLSNWQMMMERGWGIGKAPSSQKTFTKQVFTQNTEGRWVDNWKENTDRHHNAALTIQCAIRRRFARTAANIRRVARVKANYRMLALDEEREIEYQRMLYEREHRRSAMLAFRIPPSQEMVAAATKIQSATRMWLARRSYADELFYHKLQFKYKEEQFAATRIQTIMRGYLARLNVYQMQHPEAKEERLKRRKTRAAIKIQRIFRGYRQRCALERYQHAACVLQRTVRRFLARQTVLRKRMRQEKRSARTRKDHAARILQRSVRRFVLYVVPTRQKIHFWHIAARHIQRIWRGKLARDRVQRLKMIRDGLWTDELETAHQLRLRKIAQKYEVLPLTNSEHHAAVTIQCTYRGHTVRKHLVFRSPEDRAATVIQCCWRQHAARMELARRRGIQDATLQAYQSDRRHWASRTIQTFFRTVVVAHRKLEVYLRGRALQVRKDERIFSAITIQRVFRAYVVRKQLARPEHPQNSEPAATKATRKKHAIKVLQRFARVLHSRLRAAYLASLREHQQLTAALSELHDFASPLLPPRILESFLPPLEPEPPKARAIDALRSQRAVNEALSAHLRQAEEVLARCEAAAFVICRSWRHSKAVKRSEKAKSFRASVKRCDEMGFLNAKALLIQSFFRALMHHRYGPDWQPIRTSPRPRLLSELPPDQAMDLAAARITGAFRMRVAKDIVAKKKETLRIDFQVRDQAAYVIQQAFRRWHYLKVASAV
eukprot:TRINITY_DN12188_c0_g1_i1.p1 TRINITY_DN12188_c0_g1~~TRINITY_DN12188_c0_g1_i1.p1  ORF type:complete len:1162 (-),score=143.52 TRINITY_DN12188_c0_g1_i1:3-3488(-)